MILSLIEKHSEEWPFSSWAERGDVWELRLRNTDTTRAILFKSHEKSEGPEHFYVKLYKTSEWVEIDGFLSAQLLAVELLSNYYSNRR
jgi:hypothetical protein